jgi:hypothetical protein
LYRHRRRIRFERRDNYVPWLNGSDLRGTALIERKDALRRIIPSQPFPVIYNSHQNGEGKALFEAACRIDLEGIVAKWKYGTYTEDEQRTGWVKIKNRAYSQTIGRHEQFTQFRRLVLNRASDCGPVPAASVPRLLGCADVWFETESELPHKRRVSRE